jgi:hypothetical protein
VVAVSRHEALLGHHVLLVLVDERLLGSQLLLLLSPVLLVLEMFHSFILGYDQGVLVPETDLVFHCLHVLKGALVKKLAF